jgi:hypothetical protein
MSELEFQRAEDQAQVARDYFDAAFCDEDETYWLVAEGRTQEQAIATITAIEPEMPARSARCVHGWLGQRGYDAYFERDKDGPVEMWQVDFDEPSEGER